MRFAVLCCLISGIMGQRSRPGDFFPSLQVEPTAEELDAKLEHLAVAWGGVAEEG